MPFESVVGAGLALSAITLLLWSFAHLIWAFLGLRGEPRSRRLRRSLTSFLLAVAAVLSIVALYHSVLMVHPVIRVVRPEFAVPYHWATYALSLLMLFAIFSGTLLVSRWFWLGGKTRLSIAMGCLVAFAAIGIANYRLTHSLQIPAFERYSMIESRDWQTQVGQPAPDFSVTMLDGSPVNLTDLRGKTVLVNFFATWCGPCMNELPHLEELWNEVKENDSFRMLVVDRGEAKDVVTRFVETKGFTFPIAIDPESTMYKKFANEGIPRTYLISREGKIVFQTLGYGELPLYQRELETLRTLIAEELSRPQ